MLIPELCTRIRAIQQEQMGLLQIGQILRDLLVNLVPSLARLFLAYSNRESCPLHRFKAKWRLGVVPTFGGLGPDKHGRIDDCLGYLKGTKGDLSSSIHSLPH